MHEIAIIESLLEHILKQKEKHQFSKVIKIEIICGAYNCADEGNLNFCLKAVAQDACLRDTVITVNRQPERYRCGACSHTFLKDKDPVEACPQCHSENLIPQLNTELYLGTLEVE